MPNLTENSGMRIIMFMREFNSLDDWPVLSQQIRSNIRPLYDQKNRRQLLQMHDNLYHSVSKLSQKEIDLRRTGNSTQYLEQLAKCRQELQEMQQWLMFATLIDTKPEQ